MQFPYRSAMATSLAAVVVAQIAHASPRTEPLPEGFSIRHGLLVRIQGGGAPSALNIVLLNLEKDGNLAWNSFEVTRKDTNVSELLERVAGWPMGAVNAQTDSLLCSRNPHVCCPIENSDNRRIRKAATEVCNRELIAVQKDPAYTSEYLEQAHRQCREYLFRFLESPQDEPQVCGTYWRMVPKPEQAITFLGCDQRQASPWSLCLPTVAVRERIGTQQVRFNPTIDKDIRQKYEQLQGCSELPSGEKADCRASFSEFKLNAFNFGNYVERARREGSVTLPVRAYTMDIPPPVRASATDLIPSLQNATEALIKHERKSIRLDWVERRGVAKTVSQQMSDQPPQRAVATAALSRSMDILKAMGFDEKAAVIERPAVILAMDQRPFFKGNPRFAEADINAISVKDLQGRRTSCPTQSSGGYKTGSWLKSVQLDAPEHAAEVVGVMTARRISNSSVFGVLQQATGARKVYPLFIADDRGEVNEALVEEIIYEKRPVASFIDAQCTPSFPVVNLPLKFSGKYAGNNAPSYEDVLWGRVDEENAQYALFVVAAGNPEGGQGQNMESGKCRHSPGCHALSTQNMISVIGLTPKGDAPSSGSYFGTSFEVGAVGEVWTVDHAGAERAVRGSSYATPYVSSLAALIVGKARSFRPSDAYIQPVDIKTRILQTVDFLGDEALLEFGRINFSRALEINRDLLLLDRTAATNGLVNTTQPYCGVNRLVCTSGEVKKNNSLKVAGFDAQGNAVKLNELDFFEVLRLTRSRQDSGKWDLIYVEKEKSRNRLVAKRIRNAVIQGMSEITFVKAGTERLVSVPLVSVADYTRCMWRKGSDGTCIK